MGKILCFLSCLTQPSRQLSLSAPSRSARCPPLPHLFPDARPRPPRRLPGHARPQEKDRKFKQHREAHYNEFKALQEWRSKRGADMDEDSDSESEGGGTAMGGAAEVRHRARKPSLACSQKPPSRRSCLRGLVNSHVPALLLVDWLFASSLCLLLTTTPSPSPQASSRSAAPRQTSRTQRRGVTSSRGRDAPRF